MIATLPPQNHINALRLLFSRMRRTRSLPTGQEIAHAEESLRALEAAFPKQEIQGQEWPS
jgi:hypothetical protein